MRQHVRHLLFANSYSRASKSLYCSRPNSQLSSWSEPWTKSWIKHTQRVSTSSCLMAFPEASHNSSILKARYVYSSIARCTYLYWLQISNKYATISFKCTEQELSNRLQNRSADSGRIDDNPDSIAKRLRTFNEHNTEVLNHLKKQGQFFEVCCLIIMFVVTR